MLVVQWENAATRTSPGSTSTWTASWPTSMPNASGEARDVLVDDHPEWANADRFRGTKIHFGGDWAASMDAVLSALQCHSGNADAYVVARTRGR